MCCSILWGSLWVQETLGKILKGSSSGRIFRSSSKLIWFNSIYLVYIPIQRFFLSIIFFSVNKHFDFTILISVRVAQLYRVGKASVDKMWLSVAASVKHCQNMLDHIWSISCSVISPAMIQWFWDLLLFYIEQCLFGQRRYSRTRKHPGAKEIQRALPSYLEVKFIYF